MTKKTPTPRLLHWHEELITLANGAETITADILLSAWGVGLNTAHTRLHYMRQYGLPTPKLISRRKRHKIHLQYHRAGIAVEMCGEPDQPVCPVCVNAGRISTEGGIVHLHSDGQYTWCEVCGYEPDYDGGTWRERRLLELNTNNKEA